MVELVDIIRKLAPKASPALLSAFARTADLTAAELTTPLRLAHFAAQVAVETDGFTALRESGRYSAKRIVEVFGVGRHSAAVTPAEAAALASDEAALFERVYGLGNPKKARELGNTGPGDGWRYRGGGAMHTTGRAAYARIGLEASPDAIVTEPYCLRGAFDLWSAKGCNRLADGNDIRAITQRVNGGYNGYDLRVAWFNKIWPLLRGDAPAESWKAAEASPSTQILQQQLVALGYDIKVDGRFGPATAKAVAAFQKSAGVRVDGIAGDVTLAALKARLAGTAPATGSAVAGDPPGAAKPTATGLSLAMIGEGGQKLVDQADVLKSYADLSQWVAYGAMGLTGLGVACIAVGVLRSYVVPALWPKQPAVPQ